MHEPVIDTRYIALRLIEMLYKVKKVNEATFETVKERYGIPANAAEEIAVEK